MQTLATPITHGEPLFLDDGTKKVNKIEYRRIMGSLMFLCNKKLDICYDVSLCSRYINDPSSLHLKVAKIILRYVHGIVDFGIHYFATNNVKLVSFNDSDWGSNLDDHKTTSGNCLSLGIGLIT